MSADAAARLSHWWVHGVDPVARRPAAAGWAGRLLQRAQALARRFYQPAAPHTADELIALARQVEHEMPDLAAELRIIAMHRAAAAANPA